MESVMISILALTLFLSAAWNEWRTAAITPEAAGRCKINAVVIGGGGGLWSLYPIIKMLVV